MPYTRSTLVEQIKLKWVQTGVSRHAKHTGCLVGVIRAKAGVGWGVPALLYIRVPCLGSWSQGVLWARDLRVFHMGNILEAWLESCQAWTGGA